MNEPDLHISFAGLSLKNPVMTASGTFAARESGAFYDISRLGAVITKGVAAEAWAGNPTPRIAETYGGMLNAVGLQNPGVDAVIAEELPRCGIYRKRAVLPCKLRCAGDRKPGRTQRGRICRRDGTAQ